MQPQTPTATLTRASHLRPAPKPAPSNVPFVCRHSHRMVYVAGSFFFVAGDVVDTLHTVSICLDCGEEFPVPEAPALKV